MNCTEDHLRMVLESGISIEVFPIPENTNAATVADLVSYFLVSFLESLSTEINSLTARSNSSNYLSIHLSKYLLMQGIIAILVPRLSPSSIL